MERKRCDVVSVKVLMRRPDGTECRLVFNTPEELEKAVGVFWGEKGKDMLVEYYTLKGETAKARAVEAAWEGDRSALQGAFKAEGAEPGLPITLIKDFFCGASERP